MLVLTKSQLLIINPLNGSIANEYNYEEDFKKHQIESYNNYTIENDKIYFSDAKNKKIGIINLLTNKFEGVFQVYSPNADWIERPVVTKDYLYVRDSLNFLHIISLY